MIYMLEWIKVLKEQHATLDMVSQELSELDFCMDALVNLAGYSREDLVRFLKTFPEKETSTREGLKRTIGCLERQYHYNHRVDDFYKTADYLQQQGHQEEAKSLYRAIAKKTASWDDYYKRIG